LSDRFNTTRFSPHLTMGRLLYDYSELTLFKSMDALLSPAKKQLRATHDDVECRVTPYQKLIHVLKGSKELHQFQAGLKTMIHGYLPKEEYHISLLYGKIDCNALNSEISDLSKRLPKQVRFSKISVIELNGQPDTWRTIRELEF